MSGGDSLVDVSAEFAVLSVRRHCIYSPDWYKLALMYSQQESGISYGMNVITRENAPNCSGTFRNAAFVPQIILIFPGVFAKDALPSCPLPPPARPLPLAPRAPRLARPLSSLLRRQSQFARVGVMGFRGQSILGRRQRRRLLM